MSKEPKYVTLLECVQKKLNKGPTESLSGEDFEKAGMPMMGGCSGHCQATLAAYNMYPGKDGYAYCKEEIGDQGFTTTEEALLSMFSKHELEPSPYPSIMKLVIFLAGANDIEMCNVIDWDYITLQDGTDSETQKKYLAEINNQAEQIISQGKEIIELVMDGDQDQADKFIEQYHWEDLKEFITEVFDGDLHSVFFATTYDQRE